MRISFGWLVALAGCAVYQRYTPQAAIVAGVSDGDLFTAAVRVLSARGHGIRSQDREAGVLVTEWQDTSPGIGDPVRHAWRVSIADDSATVIIDCESRAFQGPFETGPRYEKCSSRAGRHPDWVAEAPQIRAEIETQAKQLTGRRRTGDAKHEYP